MYTVQKAAWSGMWGGVKLVDKIDIDFVEDYMYLIMYIFLICFVFTLWAVCSVT